MTTTYADGRAPGYKPGATFGYLTEARRQLTRRRTQWTLGLLAFLPVLLAIAFKVGGDPEGENEQGAFTSLSAIATGSALNFTLFALLVSSSFLLIVVVALFCGDAVASEASWGSLRYLLAIPVPRGRLLGIKLAVALSYCGLAFVVLTGSGLLTGWIVFGWSDLSLPLGGDLSMSTGLWRLAGVVGYLALAMLPVGLLAFLLSVSTDAPLGAVGGAVLLQILSAILDQVTALGSLRNVLPTHYASAWLGLLSDPVNSDDMVRGAISVLVYSTLFASLAWWRFSRKDVVS
ncbi:MAG: ABC transporter permease [Corynebacteriales bacterium]|nr:ABC transporter permease [Mycobacteriales bacterium]